MLRRLPARLAAAAVACLLLVGPGDAHATSGMLVATECFEQDPGCGHKLPGDAFSAELAPSTQEVYADSEVDGDKLFVVAGHLDATGSLVRDACETDAPYAGCATVPGSGDWGPRAWAPDGRMAYALSTDDHDDHWFTVLVRDPATQLLSAKGCYGKRAGCAPLPFADQYVDQLLVSPDGKQLYALVSGEIVVYARNVDTGALSPLQCVKRVAPPGDPCGSFRGGGGAEHRGIALTPDGRQLVYSAYGFGALNRDPQTGLLSQPATGTAVCETRDGANGCMAVTKDERLGGAGVPVFTADGTRMFLPNPYTNGLATFGRDPATGAFTQTGEAKGPTSSPTSGVVLSPDEKNLYGFFSDSGNAHYGAAIDFYAVAGGHVSALPAPFACQGAYQRLECGGQADIGLHADSVVFPDNAHAIVAGDLLNVMRRALLPAPTFTFGGLPDRCPGDFAVHMRVRGSRPFTTTLTADERVVARSRSSSFTAQVMARRLKHSRDDYQVGKHLIEATAVDAAGNRYAVLRFVKFGRRGC